MRTSIFTATLAALAAVMLPAPAQAASNIECVLSIRSEEVDSTVFAAYRKGSNIGEALMGLRLAEIQACIQNNKWTSQATESATRVLLGEILAAGVRKEMTAKALPTGALTAALVTFMDGLGTDKARRAANGEMDRDVISTLVTRLIAENVITTAQLSNNNGVMIGEYLSAYANMSIYRQDFKAQ